MLVTLNDVLPKARKNNQAVGLFNTINPVMAKGVIAAAEELDTPVIIGTAEVLLPSASLEELSYYLIPMAKNAKVPVVLHFDHGLTEEKVLEAMDLGFTSVMYDCSMKSLEENTENVRKMVEIAHSRGITLEAELGHVGSNKVSAEGHGPQDTSIYTDPNEALEFIKNTNCDALAVSIGTAHGVYKDYPKLDVNRLSEISKICDKPLVLHGGSGLSDEDFKACIENGISKVNIFTDINQAQLKYMVDNYKPNYGMTNVTVGAVEAVKSAALKKMKIFKG